MSDYNNHDKLDSNNAKCYDGKCPAVGYQHVSVSVPVAVIPYAKVDRIKIHCGDSVAVKQGETHCKGKKDGICCLTLSQTFCVEIPVSFGAAVEMGDTFVECLGASTSSAFVDFDEDDPL